MTTFSNTTESVAVVAAERTRIWAALTDPVLLPQLTPLLERIDADGDVWRWHMKSIAGLGLKVVPAFTERMHFTEGTNSDVSEIRYEHEPPAGVTERTGAEGLYRLTDVDGGTKLEITLTVSIDLPLPRTAGPAVRRIMDGTMGRTGDKFAENLLKHLGIDESRTATR